MKHSRDLPGFKNPAGLIDLFKRPPVIFTV